MDTKFTEVICSRCNRPPEKSYVTGFVFVTYICYQNCGNVFWTQRKCPDCKVENYTKLISKPKTGELIACKKCNFQCYYFRCPAPACKTLMYRSANQYVMGETTECTECLQKFKLLICACGGEIYQPPEIVIYEGMNEYHCKECDKKVIYTTCPECCLPEYHFEKPMIGEKIKCRHCRQARNFVPCPCCGKSIFAKNFAFGSMQACHSCKSQFQFDLCPIGCGQNFYSIQECQNTPYRKCKRGCEQTFVTINCNKCQYPFSIENYEFGYAREQQCGNCRSTIRFNLCKCGVLTKNANRCSNLLCPPPQGVKNYAQEFRKNYNEKANKASTTGGGDNYNAKQCKVCMDAESCMVNETCKHMMMCEECYKSELAQKRVDNFPCPACRTRGKYHKFIEPILQ